MTTSHNIRAAAIATGLIVLAQPGSLRAEGQVKNPTVVPAGDHNATAQAPAVEVTIVGGPSARAADQFTLVQMDGPRKVPLKGTGLKQYVEGNEPITIVVLVQGSEKWIGNSDYFDAEHSSEIVGNHQAVVAALSAVAGAGPSGSYGALLVYGEGVQARLPVSDLKQLTGDKLGDQRSFAVSSPAAAGEVAGMAAADFVAGVTESLALLRKATTPRKALIVIGDGTDTNPNRTSELKGLAQQLEKDRVEVFPVFLKGEDPDAASVASMQLLRKDARNLNGKGELGTALRDIVDQISDRYYVTFPGYDPHLKAGLSWDGNEHDFEIRRDDIDRPMTFSLLLPPMSLPSTGSGFPWGAVFVVVAGVIGAATAYVAFRRRPERAVAVVELPVPPPPPPRPTIVITEDDVGLPIVGWLVPLNGPAQFQTLKLLPAGTTKIGSGPTSDVVVDDRWVSTQHARITISPTGFTIQDVGTANGVYVNERRVDQVEIFDNDVITLGKTNLKFKSTI